MAKGIINGPGVIYLKCPECKTVFCAHADEIRKSIILSSAPCPFCRHDVITRYSISPLRYRIYYKRRKWLYGDAALFDTQEKEVEKWR